MNCFIDLPTELYKEITKYITIRCVFNLSMLSKYFHNKINKSINEHIYNTINKKSNDQFILQKNELVLSIEKIELGWRTQLILITICDNFIHQNYIFSGKYIDRKSAISIASIKDIAIPRKYFDSIQNFDCECHTSLGAGRCSDCNDYRNTVMEQNNKSIIRNILNK